MEEIMKTRHSILAFTLFVFLIGIPFISSNSAFAYSEKEPMTLKCGIDNPPGDMKSRTIKRLGDFVEQRTGGRIKFQYFYGGSLIAKPQYVDAVAKGIADISTGPVSFVTGKIPELGIFEVYGSYKLDKHLEMQEAVEPTLKELFEQKGVHHVMLQFTGSTVFPHKTKFLKKPEDWKGQKMRLAGRWQSTLGVKWGASSVFMVPGDLYIALQRGVIDGYMLIWDIVYGLKLYEVSPYIMDSGFSNNIENVTMNLKKWNALTKTDQDIFNEAVKEVKPWNYHETLKYYEQLKKDVISKGAKIYYLTPEEKSLYLKDAFSLWPEVQKISGPIGNKFMEILKNFKDQ
jgi:TRAP-type C4-dicarboxylate transport system substrate-binding protein